MLLRDSLDDAVAGVTTDLTALAAASRRRGLAIRRRRRALAGVGAVAAAAVVGAGASLWAPGADDDQRDTVVADHAAAANGRPLSGRTMRATDRAAAAALADAVHDVAAGESTRLQGAAYDHEVFAALLFRPARGSGPAGQVMVNVQPIEVAGGPPYSCADLPLPLTGCRVRVLPDGDILRSYREDDDTEYGAGSQRLVAELISPARRTRVVVNALNTHPGAGGAHRDRPVLGLAQVTEIATRSWWSRDRLPVEYAEAGARLQDFSDANADES